MNILLYLAILILGAVIGYKNVFGSFLSEKIGVIQNCALLFLLLIMGISIGIDENVIQYFGVIGYQSMILAIFSIVGSILAVKIIAKKVLGQEEGIEDDI
ncbi:LysO family transporter [Clostridium formicaceticum]|uniref:DUF340 domain-containing protein n=1 Tax=Clostridium formicaceticum TaxID=1497 RepID=A0AAC9RLF7_9CLOT|nr:LysO family transporter [Clostridium formicaceticum]AOY77007.1 DUF340 domain-containing protein [Clostridium formicaceticum]ARE87498.1 hypothetical protein CLFO_18980 [Clostridium formicaceticum]